MKRRNNAVFLLSVMACVMLLCSVVTGVAHADDIDFDVDDSVREGGAFHDDGTPEVYITLVNNSGWNLRGIWMRPSSNTMWQARDRFVSNGRNMSLANGQSVTLMPNSASRHGVRFWDIRLDYGQGKKKIISNIDAYNVDEIDIGRNFRVEFQR